MLKNDNNINNDKIIIWKFSLNILERLLTGKKPPEEINVKARFKESNDLIEITFKMIKIKSVKIEYKKNIFIKIDKQHSKYVFMSKKEILTNKKVHKFAKLYLREEKWWKKFL